MLNIHELFEVPDYKDWIERLQKDLSSEDFEKLNTYDPIEELSFSSFTHASIVKNTSDLPGTFPFTRGFNKNDNNWKVGAYIRVIDEQAANKKALDLLMKGCDLLVFQLTSEHTDLSSLLKNIGLEYIETQFKLTTIRQWNQVMKHFSNELPITVKLNLDPLLLEKSELAEIANVLKSKQQPVFSIEGYKTLESGAASFQEIAFSLSTGHHLLFTLMEAGLTIDEAAACMHFSIGIGSDYFVEIAKFRSLRTLWSNVIAAYNPEHNCSYNCSITAHTIGINKSLKDPYTNLLRQTTEGMSAVAGGVQGLLIYPYDAASEASSSTLSERMALNISLLLKEESHLDAVNDPLGGSYTVELLTDAICKNAWQLFKELDKTGGTSQSETQQLFKDQVAQKRALRIEQFKNGKKILIGLNKFPNPEKRDVTFQSPGTYLGMETLVIERDVKMDA
jgi:methylmalonyl-CoA mutase